MLTSSSDFWIDYSKFLKINICNWVCNLMDKITQVLDAEVTFVSFSFPQSQTHSWVVLLAAFTDYWRWINKNPPCIHYTISSSFSFLSFVIQVHRTVMILTAVVVSWEKERVTSLIHNTTSCGCTAFWSIFWYCQWRDWYLVLFYDGFLPVRLLMQNGEPVK